MLRKNVWNSVLGLVVLMLRQFADARVQGWQFTNFWSDIKSNCPEESDKCGDWLGPFQQYEMRKRECNCRKLKFWDDPEDLPDFDDCKSICTWQVASFEDDGWACVSDEPDCDCGCRTSMRFLPWMGDGREVDYSDHESRTLKISHLQDLEPSQQDMDGLVRDLRGNVSASYLVHEDIISPEHVAIIRDYAHDIIEKRVIANETHDGGVHVEEDYMFEIEPFVLKDLIGMEAIEKLEQGFREYDDRYSVSRFTFRRAHVGDTEHHMPWHTDGEGAIMHVYLSEDLVNGGKGGTFLFVEPDGLTKVAMETGRGIVHGNRVVHAVAPWTGTRTFLMLVGDYIGHADVMEEFKYEL